MGLLEINAPEVGLYRVAWEVLILPIIRPSHIESIVVCVTGKKVARRDVILAAAGTTYSKAAN